MRKTTMNRRDVVKGGAALTVASVFASPARAAPPPAEAVTPALIEAAKKEGALTFYTAMDLAFAERLGRVFEEKFAGIKVRVERSGAERVFQRIGQEYQSNIHAVDVVNTADQSHVIFWNGQGWLAAYLPEEVAKYYDKKYYDPDALAIVTRVLAFNGFHAAPADQQDWARKNAVKYRIYRQGCGKDRIVQAVWGGR